MKSLEKHTVTSILLIAEKIMDDPQTEEDEIANRNYIKACAMILDIYIPTPLESFPTSYEKIEAYLQMLAL